jgi:hypothetical protein
MIRNGGRIKTIGMSTRNDKMATKNSRVVKKEHYNHQGC